MVGQAHPKTQPRHGFKALAEVMAEAEENTRHLRETFDFTKDTIKGFSPISVRD